VAYFYGIDGEPDDYNDGYDAPYPDLAAHNGEIQKMRDGVAALVYAGDGQRAVEVKRNFRTLKEIETSAITVANEIMNIRIYWEDR
jgi:hypothetical protein